LIRLLAQHRVAANLAMIMMILAGVWTIKSIPTQLDPPTNLPLVKVEVEWRGASAEDIEELITTPIEQQLRTLTDLRELRSKTVNGSVEITAWFHFDADMVVALDQVKQRVANIRNLPPDIEPPTVRRFIDLEPVTALLITGDGNLSELVPIIRGFEKDLLARGAEAVVYDGLPDEEIALQVGGKRLHELSLTLDELAAEVSRISRNVPAGSVGRGQGSRQLRSLDQRRDPLSFEQLYIENGDQLIRLGEIADVVRRPRDGQPVVNHDGGPAVIMLIMRRTETDALNANRLVDDWLADVTPTLPQGINIELYNNIWSFLGAQVETIVVNGFSGLILVIGTLFLFLSGRAGFWVMVGIPVSFLLGLALFHSVFGYGISIIALIGFIMALGIVVDDAIVVGEDAVTHFENGKTPLEAAIAGAERMWVPVMTSSMTTLAAFIPLLLVGGQMGDMILALPTVLLCVIVASLVECFGVLPGHLKHSFEQLQHAEPSAFRQRFDAAFQRFRDQRFQPLVRRALDYPGATVCAAIGGVICTVSLIASQHVGVAFVVGFDLEELETNIEFSASATTAQKDTFINEVARALDDIDAETARVNVVSWVTRKNLAEFNKEPHEGLQYASLEVQYAYEESRNLSPQSFVNHWRERVTQPPFVEKLYLGVKGGANNGESDINLVLRGDDLESLKTGAEELSRVLGAYDGVSNVVDDLPYGREQLIFTLTPTGRSLGLTSEGLGEQLRAAYSGRRVQIFNQNQAELEVRVMLPDAERDNLSSLFSFPIKTPSGAFVPLSNVAVLENRRGIDVIRHNRSEMAVRIFADVDAEIANAFAIVDDLETNHIAGITERHNLSFGLSGKSLDDKIILETMSVGAVLTLVLIYLILAWVFASYLWPLAIMAAIPFGISGAIFGHWVMGMPVGAMTLLAFFSLTGIVVNDSIVLISFFKRSVEDGVPLRKALEGAVQARFRAVLLTSLTTVAGLAPLMFANSSMAMYYTPIAVTICFGLVFATLLVLLVIPAMVLLLEGLKQRLLELRHRFAGAPAPTQGAQS
jgi:multidrug efflux pump subunit AcrB